MNIKLKLMSALFVATSFVAGAAQAHLVTFGWKDNGNGTVTLWGEHWHGDQISSYSDNGGIHISGGGGSPFLAQWNGVQNNTDRDTMIGDGTLDAYVDGINSDLYHYSDWFYTDPLVIGNGTWTFFTGTDCCVDTMDNPVQVTLTGITSVPPGTGPGSAVPEPGALALFGLGLAGMAGFTRRKRKQA